MELPIESLDSPRPEPSAGVFETLLVVRGKPLEVDAHLARLRSSASALYAREPPPDVRERLAEAAAGADLARLRVTLAPGGDSGLTAELKVVAIEEAIVLPPWERGMELVPVAVAGGIGAHKWADRRLLERAEADVDPRLPLILDSDRTVLEGSRGNLFLVFGGALVTPPTDDRLLPGVTRARVIELARALGMEVREEVFDLDRLAASDEALMTGAVRGVEPVRSCRGLRDWDEGTVTKRLSDELRRIWLG